MFQPINLPEVKKTISVFVFVLLTLQVCVFLPMRKMASLGFYGFFNFVYFISYLVGSNSGNTSLVGLCHSLLQCLFLLLLCIVSSMNLLNTHISSLRSFAYSSFLCLESTSDCLLKQLLFIFLGLRYNFIHLG